MRSTSRSTCQLGIVDSGDVDLGRRGLDVIGYDAPDVGFVRGLRTTLRETFARLIAVLDVTILDRQPGRMGEPVTIKTNVLGLYRSHVNKDTAPDDVQISCEKSGYKQAKVYRRTPPGAKDMFIETECTLQRL